VTPIEQWNVRELFDSITDAVYTLDREWRITYANRPALEFFGRTADQMIGRNYWETFPRARGTVFAAAVERVMRDGASTRLEGPSAFRPDRWVELRAYSFPHGVAVYITDVTDRHRAEREARAMVDQLKLITDAIPALIAYVDTDHVYRFNNRAYENWFGLAPGAATNRHIRDVAGEAAYERVRPRVEQAFAGSVVDFEDEVPFKNGPRFLSGSYIPHIGPDGIVHGIVVIAHDVSERRRGEDLREEYNRRIEQILESTTDAFAATDTKWHVTFANARALAMAARGRDETVGALLWDLFPWTADVPFADRFHRAVVTQEPMHFEETNARTGSTLEVHLYPSNDGLGIYFRDVTDRIRIERELRASEERYRTFIEQSSEGIWRFEFSGDVDVSLPADEQIELIYAYGYLAECNDAFARMYGYDAARQIVGTPVVQFLIPEDPTNIAYLRAAIAADYRLSDAESVEVDRYGAVRYYLNNLLGIVEEGRLARVWGTQRDITDQKKAEDDREKLFAAERAARSEAENANRVKDEFLTTLSHELRTPLNAILGWSQLLRSEPLVPPTVQQGLEVIERNARSQTRMVEDLLDMSRIVTGKVRLEVRRIDPVAVIESALETIAPAAEARQITIERSFDPAVAYINGDPNRLQQVVWNLLSNAVKFTPHGGHIEARLTRADHQIEIIVRDSGLGIRPQFLPHIFERFRQADASTTRTHGGLGLGLAIVKQLVELHGGTVSATSEGEGRGATFTVALPLGTLREEEILAHDGPTIEPSEGIEWDPRALHGLRILVVDDEPDARELLRRVLSDSNAIVETAASAAEALAAVRSFSPQVLVSDIGMPLEDGYSLIRRVRELPASQGGTIPAIALTAFARSEDRRKAIVAGYQIHMSKPVEPTELITVVASLTGRLPGR
jgi:PAS domain S-box-containing protein